MLDVDDIHTYYGDSHVLQGVSFHVPAHRCTALLGRNGVGKTTTLRSIIGLTPPRRGRVAFHDEDIAGEPPYRIALRGIGYVPEDRGIFPSLSVQEHLAMASIAARGRRRDLAEIYALFPRLADRRRHRGDQLSGGEQQMLAIGRALAMGPELLLLDEPSEGLAPVIIDQLEETLHAIKRAGTTILLVEQNYELATGLADCVYVLGQGRVQYSGTPQELEAAEPVKKTYLGV
jgi:branched-chain amino acid transport system ATP-binding protein